MRKNRPVLILLLALLLAAGGCGRRPSQETAAPAAAPAATQTETPEAPAQQAPVQQAAEEVPLEDFLGITLPEAADVVYVRYDLSSEQRSFATADPDLIGEVVEETAQILVGAPAAGSGDGERELQIVTADGTEVISLDGEKLLLDGTAYETSGGGDLYGTLQYLQEEAEEHQKEASARKKGSEAPVIEEGGVYDQQGSVGLHLYAFQSLPSNYMTKKKARSLGWENGSLEDYAPGMCIGGDHFGNYEEILPDDDYRECDIGTLGRSKRGAKRIIFTEDYSRVYYTGDHYEHFTLLYGEE